MPRRKAGWTPALTHMKRAGVGRVRIPGRPDVFFGPAGIWPARQKKPPASVLAAYRKVIAEWLASGATQTPAPPIPQDISRVTVAMLVERYAGHIERHYRKRDEPTSQLRRVINATTALVQMFGDMPVAEFGARESRAVRDALLGSDQRSRRTVAAYGSILRSMFGWGESEGLVPESVALVVRGTRWFGQGRGGQEQTRNTPGRKRPVPLEDVEKTLPHLDPPPAAMVRLQLLTGMRPLEVCWMRAGDFSAEDGLLRYDARDDANKLAHLGIAKVIYLGPQAQEAIRPFLEAARRRGPDAWLFVAAQAHRGGPGHYTQDYYSKVIRKAAEKAGAPPWSPGRLRHTRLVDTRRRYGKEGAQAEAGHVNPEQIGVYTDTILGELARRIARETG